MANFRKKPVVIEAVQWFRPGDHPSVVCVWAKDNFCAPPMYYGIVTLEGIMKVTPGDWIITGVNGEHYPVKDDIFKKIYEPVE